MKCLTLNSIEKGCYDDFYDYAFDHPKDLYKFAVEYDVKTDYDCYIVNNYLLCYNEFDKRISNDEEELLNFIDFIMKDVKFIAIECRNKANKVFNMFESINSKGKKLEEIDLIKTYIFSKLDENSYDEYLKKWGQLIIDTNDRLYDYLYTYIRGIITFYRQNIKIINFKTMSEGALKQYFGQNTLCETFKKLIDDLSSKVKYYNLLFNCDEACKKIQTKKFKFYYKMFVDGKYIHPKALFFKTFIEYDEGKITSKEAEKIFIETTKFIIEFLTICGKDSKDAITMFAQIMEDIYVEGVKADKVVARITSQINKGNKGFTKEHLSINLRQMDGFDENRKLSIALLALYDSYDENTKKVSYDNANLLVQSFSKHFSLDHLLAKNPDKSDSKYKYYKEGTTDSEKIKFKSGHDFPKLQDDLYQTFRKSVLNKLGNLRIYYQDLNSQRQTEAITLPTYGEFTSYKNVIDRENKLIEFILDNVFVIPKADLSLISAKASQVENKLPKMDELVDLGEINIGDKIYLVNFPDSSEAELIEPNKVNYQGTIMSLNEWGCKITQWSSIRIYAYVAIVGETETLQQKRERLIMNK